MGDLVTVEARGVLIEREDHAQVLVELKAFAEANPQEVGDHSGVVAAADLRGALAAADFASALDEHGDLVELRFLGDKPPPDASEHWPVSLLGAITRLARRGELRWTRERDPRLFVDRIKPRFDYVERPHGLELVQRGGAAAVRPGEQLTIELELRAREDVPGPVTIGVLDSSQVWTDLSVRLLRPQETTQLTIMPEPGAVDPILLDIEMSFGDERIASEFPQVSMLASPDETDRIHEVIASWEPNLIGRSSALARGRFGDALERFRRYAARHQDRPGASFLREVAAAPDVLAALRAAQLEPIMTAAGDVHAVQFSGARLPGYERYLAGLWWSLHGLADGESGFDIAYAHRPNTWVRIAFEWGDPRRWLSER